MSVLRLARKSRTSARRKSRQGNSARVAAVLDRALRAPDDVSLWENVFVLARDDGNFEIAERAAREMGNRAPLFLAEIAIARGKPQDAVVLLKDRKEPEAQSLLAWAHFCLGQYSKAASVWLGAIDDEEISLGRILMAMEEPPPMERSISDTLALLRPLSASRNRLVSAASAKLSAELLARGDEKKKALLWARRAEWLMPFDLNVKRLVARVADPAGSHDLAIDRWKQILSVSSEDAEAHEALGRESINRDNVPAAIAHFERALASDPLRANLRVLLGDLAREADNSAGALDHWETAHRVDPKDRDALVRLADFAWEEGNIPDALEYYQKIRKIGFSPEEEEEHYEIMGYLFSEILLSGDAKHHKEAKRFFSEALGKYPKNPFLMVYEARRHVALKADGDARRLIAAALEEAPLMPEALFEMGMLLIREDQWDDGVALLHKAAQIDSDSFYKKELARSYLERDEWTTAEKWFKKALSSGSDDEEVLLGLYLALFNQKKYAPAENILRRALALSPNNMQILLYLAETLMLLSKFDAAHEIMQRVKKSAITHDQFVSTRGAPENVVEPIGAIDWLMGFSCAFMGYSTQANKHFATAHEEAPGLLTWFGDLKDALFRRMEADKSVSRKVRSVIIPGLED